MVSAMLLMSLATWIQAPGTRPIEYTVLLDKPQTQMVDLRMVIRNVKTATVDVAMPVWRPGRYEILDPAGGVRDVHAATRAGSSLPIVKTDKTTWRITTNRNDEIHVSYRVYANSLGDRTRHIDDTHAFLSPATVFFYVADRRKDPILINIEAPANWRVATGLEPANGNPRQLIAPDYDVLADSPF